MMHMRKCVNKKLMGVDSSRVGVAHTIMALLRALGLNQPPKPYEPKPRFAHYAGAVGGQCFVFAGCTVDFDKTKEELSSTVEVFDQYLEEWKALKTTGSPPKRLYAGGCCVSPSDDLYTYGGHDGSNWRGGLYKLSSLKWNQLSAESDPSGPMRKVDCRIVFFNKSKLAIIGGYGLPHGPPQPGASFVKNKRFTDGQGWTNEIRIVDTIECKW